MHRVSLKRCVIAIASIVAISGCASTTKGPLRPLDNTSTDVQVIDRASAFDGAVVAATIPAFEGRVLLFGNLHAHSLLPDDVSGSESPDTDSAKFGVAGEMPANQWVLIKYEVPDNAGYFYWRGQMAPPPCFFIPQLCGFVGIGAQDDGTKIWDGTVEVSYRDLKQLPDMPTLYRKIRNGPGGVGTDQRHVDDVAFAGDQSAIDAMRLIAQEYETDTGKLLRNLL